MDERRLRFLTWQKGKTIMQKIWIVFKELDAGDKIIAVFSSEEKALKICEQNPKYFYDEITVQ